jgi:hypothetical protein
MASLIDAISSIAGCELVETDGRSPLLEGTLSPLWAQEIIGADLAREALRGLPGSADVPVGIIDAGFDCEYVRGRTAPNINRKWQMLKNERTSRDTKEDSEHGTAVANLINSPSAVGTGERAVIAAVARGRKSLGEEAKEIAASGVRLVNLSLRTESTSEFAKSIQTLASHSILVKAAGNTYTPDNGGSSDEGQQLLANTGVIVVGSINPLGWISSSSSEHEAVTVLAPSDHFLASEDSRGRSTFGGTSGAAPLLVGALSNALSILPDLTTEEARTLILRTAQPTMNARDPSHRNGAGTLNALKLVEAAKALKGKGWPKDREKLIGEASTYEFSALAASTLAEAQAGFRKPGCGDKKLAFKALRKAFLLDPNENTRAALIRAYEGLGLRANADFYRSFDSASLLKSISERVKRNRDYFLEPSPGMGEYREFAAFRTARLLGEGALPTFRAAIEVPNPQMRIYALQEAQKLGPKGGKLVRDAALGNSFPKVRATALSLLTSAPDGGLELLMTSIRKDSAEQVAIQQCASLLDLHSRKAPLGSYAEEIAHLIRTRLKGRCFNDWGDYYLLQMASEIDGKPVGMKDPSVEPPKGRNKPWLSF